MLSAETKFSARVDGRFLARIPLPFRWQADRPEQRVDQRHKDPRRAVVVGYQQDAALPPVDAHGVIVGAIVMAFLEKGAAEAAFEAAPADAVAEPDRPPSVASRVAERREFGGAVDHHARPHHFRAGGAAESVAEQ